MKENQVMNPLTTMTIFALLQQKRHKFLTLYTVNGEKTARKVLQMMTKTILVRMSVMRASYGMIQSVNVLDIILSASLFLISSVSS